MQTRFACWASLLECYYDRTRAERFEPIFTGTDIGAEPTPLRNRSVILRFDFSGFGQRPATLEQRFDEYCTRQLQSTLRRNPDLFPDAAVRDILAPHGIHGKLDALFVHASETAIAYFYVLISEACPAAVASRGLDSRRLLLPSRRACGAAP